jgi:hypothetical protein
MRQIPKNEITAFFRTESRGTMDYRCSFADWPQMARQRRTEGGSMFLIGFAVGATVVTTVALTILVSWIVYSPDPSPMPSLDDDE